MTYGAETVQFFEIDQPLCSHVYGVAPCTAALGVTGTRKCFNTRGTCQSAANFLGTDVVTLRFSRPQQGLLDYGPMLLPDMTSLETTPASINLAAMDDGASALGSREVVTVKCNDHKHSDVGVDPYRLERITGAAQASAADSDTGVDSYVYLPGIAGNGLSTPDTVLNSVVGDIDVRWRGQFNPQWGGLPAANGAFIAKMNNGAPRSWEFLLLTSGELQFNSSSNGTTITSTATSTIGGLGITSIAAFLQVLWLRVTRVAATGLHTFYSSTDGITWTQLGGTVTNGAGAIADTAQKIEVGQEAAATALLLLPARHMVAEVRAGIGGTVVSRFNANLAPTGATSFPSSVSGEVWTMSTAGGTPAYAVNLDGYDPYDLGTFWGKWIARNPYHQHLPCRVREGAVGDALADMRVRHYVLDRIDGPTEGTVTLVAKDTFSLIEALKAVAPPASRGELQANITAVATTATLLPAGVGALDYPTPGYVAIGDEIMAYTRVGDVLTLTRGQFNSTADTHDAQDLVQRVLSYVTQPAYLIVYDLLVNYSSIDPASIDLVQWAIDAVDLTGLYTARIVEPTPVAELIGELAAQVGFTVWPEVSTGMIRFIPLRAQAPTATLDDDAWIVEGSLSLTRAADKRASQVWVYYGQINPVIKLDERRNYRSRAITADLAAESEDEYGTVAVREIFSRWIPQFGRSQAQHMGNRVLTLFRDPPLEAKLSLHVSREDSVALARYFSLRTAEVQDDTGEMLDTTFAAIEIERGENEIEIRGQEVKFFTGGDITGDRVIYIENDVDDLDLRAVHDSLYIPPLGTEVAKFILLTGNTVGSANAPSGRALRTGLWPTGVALSLEIHGRIAGAGGAGGSGGGAAPRAPGNGVAGSPGGLALLVEYAITLSGDGVIAGGGGGGGGGGGATGYNFFVDTLGGGGGGAGAGTEGGPVAPGGVASGPVPYQGQLSAPGTPLAGGAGGVGLTRTTGFTSGAGGTGGAPGVAGSPGVAGHNYTAIDASASGGAGGAAGLAIQGVALVTWGVGNTIVVIGATA